MLILVERQMRQGGLMLAEGRVRSKKNKLKKKKKKNENEKIRPIQNTPRNSQQPGDRAQLETACYAKNTSQALAHTLPLPWIPGLWKSAP